MKPPIIQRRPAEVGGGVAGAVAFLIVYALGVEDLAVYGALTVVVGFVPAGITWLVDRFRPAP